MMVSHTPNGQAFIRLERFGRTYGTVNAVRGVSLSIAEGEAVAITGPSGSGKTTLLGMIGLLESATDGDYLLRGRPVAQLPDAEASSLRNRTFGFVFQQFHLLPELCAWENVARPLVYARVPKRERQERAFALLKQFGLEDRAQHRPSQLSGGEQQRVAIARALINDPAVILADEPTGNLPKAQWQPVLETLSSLHAAGKTVILVSHDPEVAAWAERRVEMEDGRVVSA